MIKLPDKGQWTQYNDSDIRGSLFSSFGIDLVGNKGKMRSGDSMILNTNSVDDALLSTAIAFRSFVATGFNSGTQAIFALCGSVNSGSGIFVSNGTGVPSTSFTRDVTSGTPSSVSSDYSDMEIFNGYLYVSTIDGSNNMYKLSSAGSWSKFQAGATDVARPKLLCAYANRMYLTRVGNQIISWDTSDSVSTSGSNTLSLGDPNTINYITFLRASSNRIWIGTINQLGGKGYVYEWDGSSTQVTKSYRLDSSGALSCVIKDDIPYIMNTNGVIQVWNGGTFKDLDDANSRSIPGQFNRLHNDLLYNPLSTKHDRFIHPNGMSLINGNINLLVDTRSYNSSATTERTIPAGIWEYLPDVGLYHKYALTYARKTDTAPFTDSGQIKIARAGALSEMNIPSNASGRNGTFIAGAQYYTTASATAYGIWFDDSQKTLATPGYVVTQKIYSGGVDDIWQKMFSLYRKFYDSTERLIMKYRTSDADQLEATITWTDSYTCTSSDSGLANYAVGDEMMPIQGIGSGLPSHITAISSNAGTYTITLDESYAGANGQTAIAWFQHWTKLDETVDVAQVFKESAINKPATWIQFKVWFNFQNFDEIESFIISNIQNRKV